MIKLDKVLLLSHLSAWLSAIKAYVDGRIVEVSRATLEAMGDVESSITSLENGMAGKAESNHSHSSMTAATASAAGKAGFVPAPTAGNQAKFLRGDGTWQTPYTHPTSAGNKHIPSGGASGQTLKWSAAGTAVWADDSGAPSTYYGTCDTAAATTAKVVTLSNYALVTGGIVAVKFTYAVPAAATLNINSKGAKAIYHNGAAITAGVIEAGDIGFFIYDGSQYILLGVDRVVVPLTDAEIDAICV